MRLTKSLRFPKKELLLHPMFEEHEAKKEEIRMICKLCKRMYIINDPLYWPNIFPSYFKNAIIDNSKHIGAFLCSKCE